MVSHTSNDESLAAAARQGDGAAFSVLVQRYSHRLYSQVLRITGDPAEVEDLVQEALLRAFRGLPQYDPRLPFRPWLYRISTNLALDWCRRQTTQRKAGWSVPPRGVSSCGGQQTDNSSGEESWWDSLPSLTSPAVPGTEEQVLDQDERLRVRQAVMALPPLYRTTVVLHFYEEMSYQEVADVLNISPRTVGTRLYRAKQMLAAQLLPAGRGGKVAGR